MQLLYCRMREDVATTIVRKNLNSKQVKIACSFLQSTMRLKWHLHDSKRIVTIRLDTENSHNISRSKNFCMVLHCFNTMQKSVPNNIMLFCSVKKINMLMQLHMTTVMFLMDSFVCLLHILQISGSQRGMYAPTDRLVTPINDTSI